MQKSARRWTRKIPPRGPSGAALFRNDIPFGVATGGKPASASNVDLMRGNTDLERFGGGQIRGTSEDANAPAHPGGPSTNTDYVIPAAIPGWLTDAVRKSRKVAAALDLSDVVSSPGQRGSMKSAKALSVRDVIGDAPARQLAQDLQRDYDDLLGWLREEVKPRLKPRLKSAGEENEPSRADHESAPAQQMRPRAEIIVASPEGVYAIDKDDYILFPGGGIDDGEPPLIAAAREAIEEGDFHVLNPMPGGVVESLWPRGVNDFWDDSEFDGERTYFFSAIDGGRLGTTHADQEEFELIPYDTMLRRLDELMEDESAWDHANNAERRRLVAAAADAVGDEEEWKPRKLASAVRRLEGWGRYRSGLRRVFMPEEPAEFSHRLMAVEEDVGHVVHEVRRFPTGAVLIVLKSPGVSGGISERDRILARRINTMAKTAKALPTATMALTMGEPHPEEPAAGVLVDLDGTVMDSDWEPNWGGLKHQTPRQGVKPVLEELAARGIRVVGVTNRSGSSDPNGIGVEDIEGFNADVIQALPEITDIVFCGDFEDPDRKPSGAMLEFAKAHFNIDPVLAMVGDSQDDADAAAAAGMVYLTPEEFFVDTPKREALLAVVDESVASPEGLEKAADAAALLPREEYFYTSPAGEVLARPLDGRRFDFPTAGRGKRAPYSSPLRVIPETGVPDAGYHGHEYRFNIGKGDTQEFEGGQWIPIQDVLRQLYGSMGLSANRPHRDLDRARARVLHRLVKQVQASHPPHPPQPVEEGDENGVGEGDPRPEAPEVDSGFDLPAAISSGDWAQHERDVVGVAKESLEETSE